MNDLGQVSMAVFWCAAALLAYTYALSPLLPILRGALRSRPYKSEDITPTVSMVICAYNEADTIADKLDNILSLDYPRDLLEVIIASDGSNDGTNEVVASYADRGVRLLAFGRQGKIPTLNAAVAEATGEILVFSDANSIYADDAIRALVRPFADPEVGGVAGDQRYLDAPPDGDEDDAPGGERIYWGMDRIVKEWQSRGGNATSATGAIYAIRRSLFQEIPSGVTDDFVTSTGVIAQGYRLVFALDAAAYEYAAGSGGAEYRRKVRVMTRGLRGVMVRRELLNPFRFGFYSVQLFSHKALRRLMVFPLIALFASNAFLLDRGWFYGATMLGQSALYALGLTGFLLQHTALGRSKVLALPYFFCLVNFAALAAVVNIVRGKKIDRWEPPRHESSRTSGAAPIARASSEEVGPA